MWTAKPVVPTACTLVADTREGHVMRHAVEFAATTHKISQITIGDYAVLGRAGEILAVIERKSLDDYGASLKDGRHGNRHKMMELRAQTGCAVVYVVEGPLFPDTNACFSGIPYHAIESSIFHLMVRDGITVMRARDSLDTARLLARFVRSMDSMKPDDYPSAQNTADRTSTDLIAPVDLAAADPANPATPTDALALLHVKHIKTDHDIAREMWAVFSSITVESADDYIAMWSVGEILAGVSKDIISAVKIRGRKIDVRAVRSLTGPISARTQQRLLACVPGVSEATALKICSAGPNLAAVLSRGAAGIDIISVAKPGGKPRKVGPALAARICHAFAYTGRVVIAAPVAAVTPASSKPDIIPDQPEFALTDDDLAGFTECVPSSDPLCIEHLPAMDALSDGRITSPILLECLERVRALDTRHTRTPLLGPSSNGYNVSPAYK